MEYMSILKKVGIIIVAVLALVISAKLFMFYIPFLVAYIISLLVEPIIRFVSRKTNLSRKVSSVIVLATSFLLIIGGIIWGTISLISESTHLLGTLNTYFEKTAKVANSWIEKIDLDKLPISSEIWDVLQSASSDVLRKGIEFVKNTLTGILERLKSIPDIMICIVITILATYFITSDKFYIWDRLEHHVPKKILGKVSHKIKKIITSLGGYLKAQVTMVGISFVIVLMGLNIFYLMGMNVGYPLLMAIFIGFVDALPILGAGTVMIPWSIFLFLDEQYSVGFSILGLYIFVVAVRQFLEPKIVSSKIGIHPLFTLIAMYTGFKLAGIIGILLRANCINNFEKYI